MGAPNARDHVSVPTPATLPAPLQASEGLSEGRVLDDKYRVERELGAGGMGRVYRAVQLALERPVALKVIAGGAAASPEALRRFLREAVAVARLRHPNIVIVYDSGAEPGVGPYIAMELLDGRSLRTEIRERGRLPLEEALEILMQVCSAVHAAHEAGVVHRDLKPDNIVVERAPALTAKVLDFGIAKLVDSAQAPDASRTADGMLVGTPYYMSPEQCRGETVDARSDVYALGCVLYELLTGAPPFMGRSVSVVIAKHLEERAKPPSEIAEGLPSWIDDVLLGAMAKQAAARYGSAAEFAAALARGPGGGGSPRTPSVDAQAAAAQPPGEGGVAVLPQELTSFVGRADEVREVLERLSESRLVTLSGVGGIGKTRLALAAARSARDGFDGVYLAELADIHDPLLVGPAVAKAAGVRERAEEPLLRSLVEAFAGRSVLLVLDNCEHLVESCARLVEALLRECGGLRVLATSREALALPGEAIVTVPSLSLPPAGATPRDLEGYDAVRLFAARARLVRQDFALTAANAEVVGELSRKLEGIPLAIELAAARTRVLPVEQILAKMGERLRLLTSGGRTGTRRQRTLRAAIDWSYELLGDGEQELLCRLAIFAGGCTLEDAEAVCGDVGVGRGREELEAGADSPLRTHSSLTHQPNVLDGITSLVGKSLLVQADGRDGAPRFRMLEVVREYALEQLEASGEAEAA